MQIITCSGFYNLLNNSYCAKAACISTTTMPRMRKTNNPWFGNCQRIARRQVFLGVNYQSCGEKLRQRLLASIDNGTIDPETLTAAQIEFVNAGPFESGPLPWGQHDGRYFVKHKGQRYLRFYPVPGTLNDRWETITSGSLIDHEELKPFLYDSNGPVPWRTVKLRNIQQANLDGKQYQLIDG